MSFSPAWPGYYLKLLIKQRTTIVRSHGSYRISPGVSPGEVKIVEVGSEWGGTDSDGSFGYTIAAIEADGIIVRVRDRSRACRNDGRKY